MESRYPAGERPRVLPPPLHNPHAPPSLPALTLTGPRLGIDSSLGDECTTFKLRCKCYYAHSCPNKIKVCVTRLATSTPRIPPTSMASHLDDLSLCTHPVHRALHYCTAHPHATCHTPHDACRTQVIVNRALYTVNIMESSGWAHNHELSTYKSIRGLPPALKGDILAVMEQNPRTKFRCTLAFPYPLLSGAFRYPVGQPSPDSCADIFPSLGSLHLCFFCTARARAFPIVPS